MAVSPNISDDAQVMDKARTFVLLAFSGAATVEDLASIERWSKENKAHSAALAKVYRTWRNLRPASEAYLADRTSKNAGMKIFTPPFRQNSGFPNRRTVLAGGLAASVAGTALWGGTSVFLPSAEFTTAKGEQRRIEAKNGSIVRMNTDTNLDFDRRDAGRDRIRLISGEIAVQTVSGSQVCVVLAGDGEVTSASGADFAVRLDDAGLAVTCLAGEVRYADAATRTRVAAGNRLIAVDGNLTLLPVDPSTAASWRAGMLVFQDEPVSHVIEEINRYRTGRIIIWNSTLANKPVSARLRLDRLDDVLVHMREAFGANVRRLPGGIVIVS